MEDMARDKIDLFPLGIATGSAHCNRVEERRTLKKHILSSKPTHTWLWARRRMGKTSLVEQVIQELSRSRQKVVYLTIDLLVVHDAEELERRIREGVETLGVDILPKGEKATTKLSRAFKGMNPKLSVGGGAMSLQLGKSESPVESIEQLLMGLDKAAGSYKRRVVIVLDEFQQLSEMKDEFMRKAAEGAIRHAVERAKNITYVFAGSQKHLLQDMFENEDRPLYRLCRKISLDRISANDYHTFLTDAGKARWRKIIPAERIDKILAITSRHPFYVNALCARLWERNTLPTERAIEGVWEDLVEEDRSLVTGKVLRLAASQRGMLKAIAKAPNGVAQPTSQAFLTSIRLPTSTGNRSREILEEQDFIQQDDDKAWILVDPIMASYLRTL